MKYFSTGGIWTQDFISHMIEIYDFHVFGDGGIAESTDYKCFARFFKKKKKEIFVWKNEKKCSIRPTVVKQIEKPIKNNPGQITLDITETLHTSYN